MVSFQQFIKAGHDEATRKGLTGAGTQSRRQNLHRELVDFWKRNESLVRSWTSSQAREWAQNNVRV